MLNRLPKNPGSLAEIEADIGLKKMDAARIAKALGVSERTIWRWRKNGAPKTARLALWWLTHNGLSTWDAEAFNRLRMMEGWIVALTRERGMRGEGLGVGMATLGERVAPNDPTVPGSTLIAGLDARNRQQAGSDIGTTRIAEVPRKHRSAGV